ncbi:sugar transferase [Roseivirga misakiensis]|uniref:Bacterial sugar transferase domain-containing protein n=1 Tax=Roseivirga misakiensis TaxID=1563681 RepID=A0A1E5T5Y9_9BACT|nr:sugar transferase [Roseivirga misakiensis]OEK06766.1 hypothetical protein BFP71_03645 [Roseivirga misakiensis]
MSVDNIYGDVKYDLLLESLPKCAFELVNDYILTEGSKDYYAFETSSTFNIRNTLNNRKCDAIVNLKPTNDLGYINKFFECVNTSLKTGGRFFIVAEMALQRKRRILKKYPFGLNWMLYFMDFVFHRVFPKLEPTRRFYFFIKGSRSRVLHEIEVLGRLYSCGFELVKKRKANGLTYMVLEKVSEPTYSMEPTYGLFIRLNRVGKGGKKIKVRKLRSMYAYSEFIQEYIYQNYSLAEGGKLKRDPRVSKAGKIFRKYWIDELPMIWNLLNGDLKLVGVRPLSPHYLSLYPETAVEARLKTKPGLVPPFYCDMPKTFDEIVASEMKYLEAYRKNPLGTDIRYFFLAVKNILFKGARSQ